MKYSHIIKVGQDYLSFELTCSGCGQPVAEEHKYCSRCGKKLKPLKSLLGFEAVMGFLNEWNGVQHTKEQSKVLRTEESNASAEASSDCKTEPPVAVWHTPEGDVEIPRSVPRCLHGNRRPETCGHCTPKGACDATVLTSAPPQYNMCPFRGRGYIFCKDAI